MAAPCTLARAVPQISRPNRARAFSISSSTQARKSQAQATPRASPPRIPPKALEYRNASRQRIIAKKDPKQRSPMDAASALIRKRAARPDVNLLAPVHTPEDPHGLLKPNHPAASILQNSSIIVQRQMEIMNVLIGFEQANRYVILDPQGKHIGYLVEHDGGIGEQFSRQTFRTHRAFTTHVFDAREREVLRFHRPFSWLNSTIGVYDPFDAAKPQPTPEELSKGLSDASTMPLVGATQQQWAPLRRKYQMFTTIPRHLTESKTMSPLSPALDLPDDLKFRERKSHSLSRFAYVNEGAFSWDFTLRDNDDNTVGSVNRAWRGAAREILTDTGVYALRMDSVAEHQQPQEEPVGMTLDERAVMLATAVSIDFDYFSRHSSTFGFIPIPIWIPGIGGEA
ncbi:Scramblase-domain-containing protein, partial [Phyllosticta citribraziliensis]